MKLKYYRLITCKVCQAFVCNNFVDYGLQLMKHTKSKSQKIWILN